MSSHEIVHRKAAGKHYRARPNRETDRDPDFEDAREIFLGIARSSVKLLFLRKGKKLAGNGKKPEKKATRE